jgi:hypothetical protein
VNVSSAKHSTRLITLVVAFFATFAEAQVQVRSRPGFDVSVEVVDRLFNMTCRVVAEEFRLGDASEVRVPITLVLGESRDGVVGDETTRVFTIYMSRWDETMFATSVSRIALQHLLSQDRKARIVRESLRRAHLVAPLSVDALEASTVQHAPRERAAIALPRALLNRALPCPSPSPSVSPFHAESEGQVSVRPNSFCQPVDRLAP